MNNQLKTLLQFVLGVGLAGGLLYYVYKDTSWEQLSRDLGQADLMWIGLAGLALLAVFIARALRWQMMLESSGFTPKKSNTFTSVLILYLVNSITPKIGEIVRCSILYKTDKVPVSSGLGTVITERVIDALVLFTGVGLIFLFELERLGALFGEIFGNLGEMLSGISTGYLVAGVGFLAALLIGGIFFLKSQMKSEDGLLGKVKGFFEQMLNAAKSVFQLKNPALFFLYTFLIWFFLILMNYLFILSLPGTRELGIYFALLILFIGGIGWALPVPGGMGSTHFIIAKLFVAFGLSETLGKNMGALSNGVTWIYSVGFGLIALVYLLFLIYRRPQEISEESN